MFCQTDPKLKTCFAQKRKETDSKLSYPIIATTSINKGNIKKKVINILLVF